MQATQRRNVGKMELRRQSTPLREELEKQSIYKIDLSKSLYRSETHEIKIREGGEYRLSLRLKKGGLPSSMKTAFEIPANSKDQHGNATRQGLARSADSRLKSNTRGPECIWSLSRRATS
jgi:hypothetical protein